MGDRWRTCCGAESAEGWLCTMEDGHPLAHEAWGERFRGREREGYLLFDVWLDGDANHDQDARDPLCMEWNGGHFCPADADCQRCGCCEVHCQCPPTQVDVAMELDRLLTAMGWDPRRVQLGVDAALAALFPSE